MSFKVRWVFFLLCPIFRVSIIGGSTVYSNRSVELAGCSKLLAGQKVFLSPSIKPPPSEMADIITCSGGEVLTTLPHPPGVGVLIVASPDDLSMLSTAVESGMAVHSTEIILGGVLRQELDLTMYPTSNYFFITLVCVCS